MNSCKRCLLNTDVPGVSIGDSGLCSVCTDSDRVWSKWELEKNEKQSELENILYKSKSKKNVYDVLVPLSGGKDSTYVLYLCCKIFNLNCLAVTWDNGFLTDRARSNIQKACEVLGVDHLYYGLSKPLLMELYRYFFLKTGFFCPVCMRGIGIAVFRTQLAFNIPLSIRGTSLRTEEYVHPAFFLDGEISFLENVLENSPLISKAEILLTPLGTFFSPPSIKLPDYVEWDYDIIYETITRELGWTSQSPDEEHSDCKVDDVVNYIRYRKYPALIPEMLRYSKLVSCKQLSREEAEKKVSENISSLQEPSSLNFFLNELNISREEMENVISDPLKHIKYITKRNRILRRLKYIKKRFLR